MPYCAGTRHFGSSPARQRQKPNRQYFGSHIEVWAASVLSCSLQKSLSQRFVLSLPGAVTALNQLWSQNVVQTDRGMF